jgi:hypothetical protein
MSYTEALIDFNLSTDQQAFIDDFDKIHGGCVLYSVVSPPRVRLYVALRRHAVFWNTVKGQDATLIVGEYTLPAKVYFPASTAPEFDF